MSSRFRLLAATASLACAAAAAVFGAYAPAGAGEAPITDPISVDNQTYVAQPADPYNSDKLNVHVASVGNQITARTYIHLALDALPDDAHLTNASLALFGDASDTDNTGIDKAIVQACVLLQPLPATVTASNAPPFDCDKGSAVGVKTGTTSKDVKVTFDLHNLASYWSTSGNNGAIVLPVATAGDAWSLGFEKAQTVATATYALPAPAPSRPAGDTTPAPQPAVEPAPVSSPAVRPSPAVVAPADVTVTTTLASPVAPTPQAAERGGVRTLPGTRSKAWIWVLLAALVVAALLASQPVIAVATAGAGHMRTALVNQLQMHGRAMTTSAVVVLWTVTYTIYSVAVTPVPRVVGNNSTAAPVVSTGGNAIDANGNIVPVAAPEPGTGAGVTTPGATGSRPRTGAAGGGAGGSVPADEANLPAAARLFSAADDRIGITDKEIKICGHAALVFGPAFDIKASDLNVFWDEINARGGINGRRVTTQWIDDTYQPGNAVTAAQQCKDSGAFMLLSGIGFDQIPAVRAWAETNKMLYLHHVAVKRGSEGLRYSFTGLPSVEEMGRMMGELAVSKYKGQKVGIMSRQSSNWRPGRDEFVKVIKPYGMYDPALDFEVTNNQGNYTQQIVTMKNAGAQVVFAWENALSSTEMLRQAKGQSWNPHWLLFPFNLTLQTVRADALNPPLDGVAAWPAYTFNDHAGPYASYASDLAEFERQYRERDPSANLDGFGGDLLFLAWVGFKQVADMMQTCGRDCTRNKMAAVMLNGYHKTVTPNCDADFTGGNHHRGAPRMDVFQTAARPDGGAKWIPLQRCISSIKTP